MWLWCLTVSFYGFSLWLYVLEPQGSFCRLLVYMTSENLQIVKSQTLLGQAKDLNWVKEKRTHQDPLILANIIYQRGPKIKKKTLLISSGKKTRKQILFKCGETYSAIQRHLTAKKTKRLKETLTKKGASKCVPKIQEIQKSKKSKKSKPKKNQFSRSEKKNQIIFFKNKIA